MIPKWSTITKNAPKMPPKWFKSSILQKNRPGDALGSAKLAFLPFLKVPGGVQNQPKIIKKRYQKFVFFWDASGALFLEILARKWNQKEVKKHQESSPGGNDSIFAKYAESYAPVDQNRGSGVAKIPKNLQKLTKSTVNHAFAVPRSCPKAWKTEMRRSQGDAVGGSNL